MSTASSFLNQRLMSFMPCIFYVCNSSHAFWKGFEFFTLCSRAWNYLRTGLVHQSPRIWVTRFLKVLEFFLPCNNGICVHSYWCTHLISWTKDVHKTRCTLCLKDIDLSSLRESLWKFMLESLSRYQTIDKVGQLFGRGLFPKTIGWWNRWTMTRVTCHVTIVTSKKWQTIRTPTLLCCFIFFDCEAT